MRATLNNRGVMSWLDSDKLKGMTTGGTNNKTMVVGRIEYVANKFGAT
jgi:hypothetical protein